MRKFLILALSGLLALIVLSFKKMPASRVRVKWQTADQVTTQWDKDKKPILVDIYTDWCHYCKVMDKTTYGNDSIANYINEHFYSAKVNAESKSSFNWLGKTYAYVPKFKLNELAISLTNGNIVFPTTVVIPVNGQPQPIAGAMSVSEMEMFLKYFGEGHYGKISWEDYTKGFKPKW